MSTVRERLSSLWLEVVGASDVADDADFAASGGTSLAAVHLAAEIQDEFGVAVDAIEIIEQTFGGIVGLVETRAAA